MNRLVSCHEHHNGEEDLVKTYFFNTPAQAREFFDDLVNHYGHDIDSAIAEGRSVLVAAPTSTIIRQIDKEAS